MNKFLRHIGWKDYRGRLDTTEIKTDLLVLIGIVIVGLTIYMPYIVVQNG